MPHRLRPKWVFAGVPAPIRREVQSVFPKQDLDKLLIVPTCQHADLDLVNTGEKVEGEKDRLLERVGAYSTCKQTITSVCRSSTAISVSGLLQPYDCTLLVQFMAWAKVVCDKLLEQGHWADYIDPCSGLPVSVHMCSRCRTPMQHGCAAPFMG